MSYKIEVDGVSVDLDPNNELEALQKKHDAFTSSMKTGTGSMGAMLGALGSGTFNQASTWQPLYNKKKELAEKAAYYKEHPEEAKALAATQGKSAAQSTEEQKAVQANDPEELKKGENNSTKKDDGTNKNKSAVTTIQPGNVDPQGIKTTYNPSYDERITTGTEAQQHLAKFKDMNSSVFPMDVKVFIEGVQVPHSQVSVSYGITSPATCTITMPAHGFLRTLPGTTKILVVFADLCTDEKDEIRYRVLFDGELSSFSYGIDPNGAYFTISGIHSTAYLTLMQLFFQDVKNFLECADYRMLGDSVTFATAAGFNKAQVRILGEIFHEHGNSGNLKSMADVVYLLVKFFLEHTKGTEDESAAAKWYFNKLGNTPGGYKILQRIFGVSDSAKQISLDSFDNKYEYNGGKVGDDSATGAGATGGSYGYTTGSVTSVGTNGSLAAQAAGAAKYVEGKIGLNASFIFNQWVLESGWFGNSTKNNPVQNAIFTKHYNFGCIHSFSDKMPWYQAYDAGRPTKFMSFKNVQEFADAYIKYTVGGYMKSDGVTTLAHLDTPQKFAAWLKKHGYYESDETKYANGIASISGFEEYYAEYKRANPNTVSDDIGDVKEAVVSANTFEEALERIYIKYKGTKYTYSNPEPPKSFNCASWCSWVGQCVGYTRFKGDAGNDALFSKAVGDNIVKGTYYALDYAPKAQSFDNEDASTAKKLAELIPEDIKKAIGRDTVELRAINPDRAHASDGTGGDHSDQELLLNTARPGDILLINVLYANKNNPDISHMLGYGVVRGHSGVYAGKSQGKHMWYEASTSGVRKSEFTSSIKNLEYIIYSRDAMEKAWSAAKKEANTDANKKADNLREHIKGDSSAQSNS